MPCRLDVLQYLPIMIKMSSMTSCIHPSHASSPRYALLMLFLVIGFYATLSYFTRKLEFRLTTQQLLIAGSAAVQFAKLRLPIFGRTVLYPPSTAQATDRIGPQRDLGRPLPGRMHKDATRPHLDADGAKRPGVQRPMA
jgi:hypothetical protein